MRMILLLLAASVFLSGCSYFYKHQHVINDRDTDYLKARSIPPMKVPPGMSANNIEPHFPVANRTYAVPAQAIDLTPPGLTTGK